MRIRIVAVSVITLLSVEVALGASTPPAAYSSPTVTYALHKTNGGRETGEIQVSRDPQAEPAIWVVYSRALSSDNDAQVYLLKGLCGETNAKQVKVLQEGPPQIALDMQGHDHVLVTKYRHWALDSNNAAGLHLINNGYSVQVRGVNNHRIQWCGDLVHGNEREPIPNVDAEN